MAQALIPLKDLVGAKTRLSGLLRPGERRALAQAMVEDVLGVVTSHSGIDRITLVSDDPGADLLAGKYGIDALDERTLGCRGLNSVLESACAQLLEGSDEVLVVMHGDLPLLSSEDVSAVLHARNESGGLVIGCDRFGVGTNLLAFESGSKPVFAFGSDSCARHRRNALETGIPVDVLRRIGIGLDIDQPEDIELLIARLGTGNEGHTAQLLLQTELGKRMEMLLDSMDGDGQIPQDSRIIL
jgi:2-phospho-L-lactate guanylyltransferase